VQVSAGDAANVWVVSAGGLIFRWTGGGWAQVPGSLTRIAVSAGGRHVVGVNRTDDVFAWTGAGWQAVPGKLQSVSVSGHHIVGTNGAHKIYHLPL